MRITEEADRIVGESSVKNFCYNLRSTKFNFFLLYWKPYADEVFINLLNDIFLQQVCVCVCFIDLKRALPTLFPE